MKQDHNAIRIPDGAAAAATEPFDLGYSRRNALRRLVRCLFAEGILDRAALVFAPQGRQACLPLWSRHGILFFDDLECAPAETYINHGGITLVAADGSRTPVTTHEMLIDVLRPHFDFSPTDEGVQGLKSDMANSIRNDAHARAFRQTWSARLAAAAAEAGAPGLVGYLRAHASVREAALLLDQWGSLEGHPYYPTWKSKPGLTDDEVERLSPEFGARVPVRIAALRADNAYLEHMPHVGAGAAGYQDWFAQNFPALWHDWSQRLQARGLRPADWLPLPVHGWHLRAHVTRAYADEIAQGLLVVDGPDTATAPTMSFRTVLPIRPDTAPLVKLPVALWMTSEQRSLQAKSIHMGPRISTVIQRILAAEQGFDGMLEIYPEEAGLHYRNAVTQDDAPGKHLSVVFRASSAALDRSDGSLPVTVATLFTASPCGGRPLFTELVEAGSTPATRAKVSGWFRQYARSVARPVIAIYLLYGIGLEAHQQNTQVLFGADGQARGLLVRDFGDGRTYAPLLEARGHALQPYVWPGILPTVFSGDIEPVRTFVIDACFVSHLHEVALGLTAEYRHLGLDDGSLWQVLREETEAAFDAVAERVEPALWQTERHAFLAEPWHTRSLLRMHLMRYTDYRVQHGLANPLGGERA